MIQLLASTAFGAALIFGFRHGFDWDHIAALTDLTGSQTTSRRSMWLATLYALGHAAMVLALGAVAILFAERLPESVDVVMERFVGVSLVALAGWMIWTAATTRGAPPLRSRWMMLIDAGRRVAEHRRRFEAVVVIEHAHQHAHHHPLHQHQHPRTGSATHEPSHGPLQTIVRHRHTHRHVAPVPRDPFTGPSSRSAFGIGLLHGVGAETPTQILIFAAAANASGRPTSIALLVCFVAGLVGSNTLVAAASTLGLRRVLVHPRVALGLAVVTATFSLAVGSLLLAGQAAVLPPILGG